MTERKNFFKIILVIDLNVYCELGELKFEWDSEKAERNYKKHNVLFKVAARVFLDENRIDEFDEIHSEAEDRYKIIGKAGKILVVIYTERGERNKIVSARLAEKDEQEDYYGQFY